MNLSRVFKLCLITIASVIILVGIAITAMIFFVNPNNYKPLMIKAVDESTGRKLNLNGNISWKLWPNIGLHIADISLSNPKEFQQQTNMVSATAVDVSVQLLPLLHNSIIVNSLSLEGLNLALIKNGELNNWTFNNTQSAPNGESAPASSKMQLELSSLTLKNSTISYTDMEKKTLETIKDFDFALKASQNGTISLDQEKEILILKNVSFSFANLIHGDINITLNDFNSPKYSGDIKVSEFSIIALTNKLDMPIKAIADKDLFNKFTFTTTFNGDTDKLKLDALSFNFGQDLNANISVAVDHLKQPHYSGKFKADSPSINTVLDKLNIDKSYRANNQLLTKFSSATDFNGDTNNLKLDNFVFNFADHFKGTANINVANFATPEYSGNINLPAFSANYILDQANITKSSQTKNQLLNSVALDSKFTGSMNDINIQQLNFNLSDLLRGTSSIKVQNFKQPTYSGNIKLPTFSLNQVMEKSGMDQIDIPNKTLLNQVSYSSNFSGNSNSIKLDQIAATIPNSNLSGDLNITSIKPLKLNENLNITQIELSDITDTYGYKIPLHTIKANGSYSNSSSDMKNMSNVDANQNISVANVTVLGFSVDNLLKQLDGAITNTGKAVSIDNLQQINNSTQVLNSINNMKAAIANAQTKGPKDYSQKTNLGSLQANVVINHGIANPATFKLSGPTIKSSGQGTVNLVQKTLNYTVTTQLITPQKNNILNQILFPYILHGSLDKMDGSLDWGSIQKQLVEYLIKNTTSQVKSAVKGQAQQQINTIIDQQVPQGAAPLKQGAQKLLNGIFGN